MFKKLLKNKKGHDMSGHLFIGAAVLAVLFYINQSYKWITIPSDTWSLVALAGVGLVYSLMPDIDQPGSIINKWVAVSLVGLIVFAFMKPEFRKFGIVAAFVLGLLKVIHHRPLIHSLLGGVILAAPLFYFGVLYFAVGLVAFLTHIVIDGDFSIGWEKDWKLW